MARRLALALALMAGSAHAETSRAAQWVAKEQIALGCTSGTGTIIADGIRELDFNGDGRLDLIFDHNGILCDGTGMATRSTYCGAQVCSTYFFIRNEDGLLVFNDEVLGNIRFITDDTPPVISGFQHGGAGWSIVWSNGGFQSAE